MAKKGKTMLSKRPPMKQQESAFGKLASGREAAELKRNAKHAASLSQVKSSNEATMTGAVRNTTRIGSVLQSKVAKKDSRYKRLFALDDEDDDAEGLTDRPHIVRDDAFADEGDKFVEFVAEDMERGQVHPKILEKINSFGIDKEDPEKKKTKKEIFQDVIRKSKHEKMLRQKGQAEQKEKIKLLDDMFTSLFPALTISDDRYKPKNEETRQYDTLRNELIFEPTMPPEHLKKEGKEATSSKRKKIDLPENDENGEGEDEEGEEDGGEEGEEEEEYEDYEDKGDDQEQLQEREIDTRKFKERIGGKKEKLEENCGRTVRNLKMLGELEDQLLEEFVRGMNDQDLDGEEEEDLGEEEQFIGGEGEEEFEGDDEMGDEELEGGEEGEEEDEQDED